VLGVQPGAFRTNTVRLAGHESRSHGGPSSNDKTVTEPALSPRTFLPLLVNSSTGEERGLYQHPTDDPDAYKGQIEMARKSLASRAGKEPGDPEKAVKVLVNVVKGESSLFVPAIFSIRAISPFRERTVTCI
jgi:hypothetical protein